MGIVSKRTVLVSVAVTFLLVVMASCLIEPMDDLQRTHQFDPGSSDYQGYHTVAHPDQIVSHTAHGSRLLWPQFVVSELIGATEYQLQIASDTAAAEEAVVYQGAGHNGNVMNPSLDAGFVADTPYHWRARARAANAFGRWTEWSSFELVAPGGRSPENGETTALTQPTVRWDAVDEASEYEVQFGTSVAAVSASASLTTNQTTLEFPFEIDPGSSGYWRVRAKNDRGVFGAWSAVYVVSVQSGSQILFTADSQTEGYLALYVMDVNATNATLIRDFGVENLAGVTGFRWNPDKSQIAFRHPESRSIHLMNADGTNRRQVLSRSSGSLYNVVWNQSGSGLFYSYSPTSNYYDANIYLLNLSSQTSTTIRASDSSDMVGHAAAGLVAFEYRSSRNWSFSGDMYVMNEDGTNVIRVTARTASNYFNFDETPALSADGTMMAWRTTRYEGSSGSGHPVYWDIVYQNLSLSTVHRLTASPLYRPSVIGWYNDGQNIIVSAASDESGNNRIYSFSRTGETAVLSPPGLSGDIRPHDVR